MESIFKYKCLEIDYAEQAEKDVPASKKYMFWIITFSGGKSPLQKVTDQKKFLLPRSSC